MRHQTILEVTRNADSIATLWTVFFFRALQTGISMLLCVSLYFMYEAEWRYLQITHWYWKETALWPVQRILSLVGECFVCLIHEFPLFEYALDVSLPVNEQNQIVNGIGSATGPVRRRWRVLDK